MSVNIHELIDVKVPGSWDDIRKVLLLIVDPEYFDTLEKVDSSGEPTKEIIKE